jgi:hypothetical protein
LMMPGIPHYSTICGNLNRKIHSRRKESVMSGQVFAYEDDGLHSIGGPHFFQGEMVSWLYRSIRRSKAGGMHLMNCKELKTGKDLKCPAVRLTGSVRPVLSRPFISLEKMGASDAWRTNLIFMHKPNRTSLNFLSIIIIFRLFLTI